MSSPPCISQGPQTCSMPQRHLTTPLPVATQEATSCPTCALTEIWPCWPSGPFCTSLRKSGCHCGGCCPLPDITSTNPPGTANRLHPHLHPPTDLVRLSQESTLTTLMTCTKVGNRRKRWEAQEDFSKNSPGKGLSANRLAVGSRQCHGQGVRCGGREATVQITRRHGAVTVPWQRERAKRTVRQGARALWRALDSSSTLGPLGAGGGPLPVEKADLWVSGVSVPLLDPSGCRRRPQCSEQGRRDAGYTSSPDEKGKVPTAQSPQSQEEKEVPFLEGRWRRGGAALPMQEEGAGGQGAAGGQSGAGDYV